MRNALYLLIATLGAGPSVPTQAKLFLDEGAITSWNVRPPTLSSSSLRGVAFGDVDGDGDVDIVYSLWIVNASSSKLPSLVIAFNDGAGSFVRCALARCISTKTVKGYSDLALVDLDRDGDLDLVHLDDASREPVFWANDGNGVFARPKGLKFPAGGRFGSYSLEVGDLDGDGDLDLVVGFIAQPDQIFINQGNWTFTAGFQFSGSTLDYTDDIVIGDANADGLMDILFLYRYTKTVLWYGVKRGGYRIGPAFDVLTPSPGAIVDLDGDGIPEILLGDRKLLTARIYKVDGKGGYRIATILPPQSGGPYLVMDWDRDGDLDLYAWRFWQNDGKLKFQEVSSRIVEVPGRRTLDVHYQLVDLDGDHDQDLVFMTTRATGTTQQNRYGWIAPAIIRNRERHLKAPQNAKIGSTVKVEMTADDGHIMLLALSVRESNAPLGAWGVLRIDPTAAVFLPGRQLTGRMPWSRQLPVPKDNGLVGLTVRFQALDFSTVPSQPTRLTGLQRTRIVR